MLEPAAILVSSKLSPESAACGETVACGEAEKALPTWLLSYPTAWKLFQVRIFFASSLPLPVRARRGVDEVALVEAEMDEEEEEEEAPAGVGGAVHPED